MTAAVGASVKWAIGGAPTGNRFLTIPRFSACDPQARQVKVEVVGDRLVTSASAFEHPTAGLGLVNR